VWSAEGVGTFDLCNLDDLVGQDRGTATVIHLKNEHIQYSEEKQIAAILKKNTVTLSTFSFRVF
jgi:HSP90 family molecular chaperone